MSMTPQNTEVDAFVSRARKWQGLIRKLRSILLECGLDEDLKWGKPCFMFDGKNVAIIQPFKQHCSLMFFNGTLLQAPGRRRAYVLHFVDAQQSKTRAARIAKCIPKILAGKGMNYR